MQAENAEPTPEPTPEETPDETPEALEAEAPADEPAAEGEEPAPEEPAAAGGEEDSPAPEPTAEQKHKRAGGFQRKIDRLERQVAEKDAMLAQALARLPQPAGTPPKEKTQAELAADHIDKLVDQRLAAREAQKQEETRIAEFKRRYAEAAVAHDDFDDVVQTLNVPVNSAMGQSILTSEKPGEIMYQLGRDPAELARISALPPLLQAREIFKLEAKSASGQAPQTPRTANRPPAPPSKVGGSPSSTRSLDDLPISEFKRARRSGRS